MTLSAYMCRVVGETPQRAARFHISTIRRTTTFAIAIHIPVLMWAVTGFVIAWKIFGFDQVAAAGIAFLCASLIYLVERVVIATPKTWFVNITRLVIGMVIALLGASTVDLVIFDREIAEQIQADGEAKLVAELDQRVKAQETVVVKAQKQWLAAREAAQCEANGTCGSKVRSVGPVYRELAKHAEQLQRDYAAAKEKLAQLQETKSQAVQQWRQSPPAADKAGLLARVQALHTYTLNNTAAMVAWVLFFVLMLFFELMVVIAKLVFKDTVDDELDRMREQISLEKARAYMDTMFSPLTPARELLAHST